MVISSSALVSIATEMITNANVGVGNNYDPLMIMFSGKTLALVV